MQLNIYQYETASKSGINQSGQISATSRQEALLELRKSGIVPTKIRILSGEVRTKDRGNLWEFLQRPIVLKKTLNQNELAGLLRQLASLLKAGMPIDRSLALLIKIPRDSKARSLLSIGYEQVQKGNSLSHAWDDGLFGFPTYAISMIGAGEATGNLEDSLNQVATIMENNVELRSIVSSSLIYPVFLLCVSIAVVAALLVYAVPQFLGIFSVWGEELPVVTRVLVNVSQQITNHGPLFLIFLIFIVSGILVTRSTVKGKLWWDTQFLKFPLLGAMMLDAAMARMFQTTHALLQGGISLPQAVRLAAPASNNLRLSHGAMNSAKCIEQGVSLSQAFLYEGIFPETVIQLVAMGEETGDLGPVIRQLAELLERQTRQRIHHLTTLLEPTMILLMALVVGFIVLAILLPIVTMMDMPF